MLSCLYVELCDGDANRAKRLDRRNAGPLEAIEWNITMPGRAAWDLLGTVSCFLFGGSDAETLRDMEFWVVVTERFNADRNRMKLVTGVDTDWTERMGGRRD